jgi:hypothetical protein
MVSENVRDGFAAPPVDDSAERASDEYLLADGGAVPEDFVTPSTKDALASAVALRHNRRSKAAQSERNFALELVKVAVGGIAGLFLGLIVLWWLFRSDPLELGPSVARYAAWIVPPSLQGRASQSQMNIVHTKSKANDASRPAKGTHEELQLRGGGIEETGSANEKPRQVMPDLTDLLADSPAP